MPKPIIGLPSTRSPATRVAAVSASPTRRAGRR